MIHNDQGQYSQSEYILNLVRDYYSTVLVIFTYIQQLGRLTIMKRDLTKTLFVILLPAVIWLFINATVNRHNHYLSGGYLISHAHPYDKTPQPSGTTGSHQHSESELLLISLVSDPVTTASILFMLCLFVIMVYRLFKTFTSLPVTIRNFYQVYNYHAPPGL